MVIRLRSAVIIGVVALLGAALWLYGTPPSPPCSTDATDRLALGGAWQAEAPEPESEAMPLLVCPTDTADAAAPVHALQALNAQVQQYRQQLQAQQYELQRQQHELSRLRQVEARVADAGGDDTPTEVAVSQEEREETQVTNLEATLDAEHRDPRWSQEAVAQIVAAVEQSVMARSAGTAHGSTLVAAHCSTTLCRLVLDHDSRATMENFLGEFPQQLGWQSSAYINTHANPDDSITTVLFLSRDGHPLPEIDR